MKKKLNAYYKAFENMINLSKYKDKVIELLPTILQDQLYTITRYTSGEQIVNFDKLQEFNNEQVLHIMDSSERESDDIEEMDVDDEQL